MGDAALAVRGDDSIPDAGKRRPQPFGLLGNDPLAADDGPADRAARHHGDDRANNHQDQGEALDGLPVLLGRITAGVVRLHGIDLHFIVQQLLQAVAHDVQLSQVLRLHLAVFGVQQGLAEFLELLP